MKQYGFLIKAFSVLLAFCFLFAFFNSPSVIYAYDGEYDDNYDNLSLEEKQALIEQKLKETNEKLESLGDQSRETQEYIDTLDEKIKYLQRELSISENEIESSKNKITTLEHEYEENEDEIKHLKVDIEDLSQKTDRLQIQFDKSYEMYCQRVRALYISGDMSVLSMLLTSPDISTLLTRLEMIKRVSKNDRELLQSIEDEANELKDTKTALQAKRTSLTDNQNNLKQTSVNLSQTVKSLEQQQVDYKEKQSAYESEKTESDRLLQQLHEETDTYSEYRNQDQAELDQINAEIEAAAEKFRQEMEAKKHTTTAPSQTQPQTEAATEENDEDGENYEEEETQPDETTEQEQSGVLQMTYPVPSQTNITCGYGSAGYAGHTGVDFSCRSGSKVVAAESGYVLISTDLTDANGNYRSYGRYIVIAHDKLNSDGQYVYTLYAHNSQRIVSEGQYVKKGQLIAYSGSTGNSTGPHCHFEVRTPSASYDDCVNPNHYLP